MQKGECGGKSGKDFPKNRPKSDAKRGKTRKKWTSQGKKRVRALEKVPEIESKAGKTEILERKKWGGGEMKKWALLPILQRYEMAKWVQMKFSRNFFSAISCRECRNALPLHSQSGSNALARESYALKAPRQRKRCCDL